MVVCIDNWGFGISVYESLLLNISLASELIPKLGMRTKIFLNDSMKSNIRYLFLLILFIGASQWLHAQCAMCKASAETTAESGEFVFGGGLNVAILYLLALPFLAAAAIGYFWFKRKRELEEMNK